MRVIVTGAGGFVGRRLVAKLHDHEVIALDTVTDGIPAAPNVTLIRGDLCDEAVLRQALAGGCDAVVHLATVLGGAAEQSPDLARRVNVDATMLLSSLAGTAGKRPRFVFASSIAVFGDPLPGHVDDMTQPSPKLVYGAHKAMMEQWLAAMTRRGEIDAVSLRLSGVVARPTAPSGMKSAFLSGVFHALSAGQSYEMPVSTNASCWLTSVECAAENLVHALTVGLERAADPRAVTLPTLRVRIGDLVAEIARQTGQPVDLVGYSPEAVLQAAFGSQPPVMTTAARGLGFTCDGDMGALVARALRAISASD